MAGYTRQSTADILAGEDVAAEPLNAEFERLQLAFGLAGHTHDGTAGNAPKIDLSYAVTGVLPIANGGAYGKNNITAITAPTITDDGSKGYVPGSLWVNTSNNTPYIMVNNQNGAAVWNQIQAPTGTFLTPGNNLSDVQSSAIARQNLGLVVGTNVQAYSSKLNDLNAITTDGSVPYVNASNAYTSFITTTFTRGLMASTAASNFKSGIGLGNVDNTSDLDKPVSTATQAAIDAKTVAPVYPIVMSNPSAAGQVLTASYNFTARAVGYTADTTGYYSLYGFPQTSRTLNIYTQADPNTVFKTVTTTGPGNGVTANFQTLGLSVNTTYLAELVFTDALGNTIKTAKITFVTPAQFKPNVGEAYEGGFLAYEKFGDGNLFDLVTAAKSTEASRQWDGGGSTLRSAFSRLNGPLNTTTATGNGSTATSAQLYASSISIGGVQAYLAAIDEARAISFKLRPANAPVVAFQAGGSEAFPTAGQTLYWSSTEVTSTNSFRTAMDGSLSEQSVGKDNTLIIRPIKRIQLTPPYAIGTAMEGGYLAAYFTDLSSGTPVTYMLIVADKATEVTRAWSTVSATKNYSSRTNGVLATNDSASSTSYPASAYCYDLVSGGQSDWYLGAIDEMLAIARMNENLPTAQRLIKGGNGVWSSTEIDSSTAKIFAIPDAAPNLPVESSNSKSTTNWVRPIRRVVLPA